MGIYYSSVGTRLVNYLKLEGLTLEDFSVLSPDMTMYIKNLGKKSRVAVEDWLEENNLQAGKWDGREKGMTWYKALDYYKEHRDELRKAYPPKPIEQAEEQPKEDDWEEYRKRIAEEVLLKLTGIGYWEEIVGAYGHPEKMFVSAYSPKKAAEFSVSVADALIKNLKEIH